MCTCFFPGCGEHLIRTMLARECSSAMQTEDAHRALLETMQNKFISECPTVHETIARPLLKHNCVSQEHVCTSSCARGE